MNEDDYLMLSGIQHIAFCERQWALIHVEQLWLENERTISGKHLHERTDDSFLDDSRGSIRTVRGMPLVSHRLRLRGIADVVEFQVAGEHVEGETCRLQGRKGFWRPVPVEYKHGVPKKDDRDIVQLCAQAMALEEMMGVTILVGFMFYGQKRRRQEVCLNDPLRERTVQLAERMTSLFRQGITPRAPKGKRCSICSLVDICVPRLGTKRKPVGTYLEHARWEVGGECDGC